MFAKTLLDNGIRVTSEEMENVRSVSLGVWVENGSRHEPSHQSGISHFIEHLLFKGTERRSAARIAQEIDSVGGVLNAFTAKEYTCYYAKVLDEHLPLAVDLLADLFLHSLFDREEIEKERLVILQEISQVEDTPDDYVHDLFHLDFFREHALGRPICGEAATIKNFHREDFLAFMRRRYLPGRVVVAAAGHLRHGDLIAEMEQRLGAYDVSRGSVLDGGSGPEESPRCRSGIFPHAKPLEQVHLCLGVPGVHQTHPLRYAAYVLNTILGGGMSSRLFQEIREKRGRVYSIYSFVSAYRDVGSLGVYAGTSAEWLEEVVDLVLGELRSVAREKVAEEELRRAQNQLLGNIVLGLESSDSWMSHIAKNEIYFGEAVAFDEIARGIRAVTREDVIELARTLFHSEGITLTLLGNLENEASGLSVSI
jgi:predicted Zn-dependent peptidase